MSNDPTNWRRSRFSANTGNCVEVGRLANGAAVRDTKDRAGGYFTTTADQWRMFLTAIKSNRFR